MEFMETDEELPKSFKASLKSLNFGVALKILFLFNGFLCGVEIVLQLLLTRITRNFIYFAACFLFGPFQLMGIFLLLIIDLFKNRKTRYKIGVWATRLFTIAFIPCVNTIALNFIQLMACQDWKSSGEQSQTSVEVSSPELEEDEYKYCGYVVYNAALLILCVSCAVLNLVFCIPFNVN